MSDMFVLLEGFIASAPLISFSALGVSVPVFTTTSRDMINCTAAGEVTVLSYLFQLQTVGNFLSGLILCEPLSKEDC